MRVIGTAGHVDHGKSTLVQALTGINPDRLKEERDREMTIDLGFAWMTLPDGEDIGIVDVPGHRDFIENMLAGVGGIDAVLFVIAADEGIMPQTREHLDILDLLQTQGGVCALTKIDLVDHDWLSLVESEIQQTFSGTILQNAPIIPVSAKTGQGLDHLKDSLQACLADYPPRLDKNRARLPIDRVFSIAGFGTIVTGTLTDGILKIADEIELLPSGLRGRIRGLQTHKKKEEIALPGSRTAVNLVGIPFDRIRRGQVIAHPGDYVPIQRLDAQFKLLDSVRKPIKHNTEVKMYLGTAEVIGRIRLIDKEEIIPGDTGFIQLELNAPVIGVTGDRYILRRPSPPETLGGGCIVDPHPKGRHKRGSKETIAKLESLLQGSPEDILLQASMTLGPIEPEKVIAHSDLTLEIAIPALLTLIKENQLIFLESINKQSLLSGENSKDFILSLRSNLVVNANLWGQVKNTAIMEIQKYHRSNPLRQGMSKEELRSRLKNRFNYSPKVLSLMINVLVDEHTIQSTANLVKAVDFEVKYTPEQERLIRHLMNSFIKSPYSPPSVKECTAEIGDELFQALLDEGRLVLVSQDVVFRKPDYDKMIEEVIDRIKINGQISVGQARDHFMTSRKYILALLEHMDERGLTIRDNDFRRLSSQSDG